MEWLSVPPSARTGRNSEAGGFGERDVPAHQVAGPQGVQFLSAQEVRRDKEFKRKVPRAPANTSHTVRVRIGRV